uniref:Chromodomain helicase DNA binding protein 9 n=1 Tax=Cyprinus carpio TaxID=7962 RepID=A0A8C1NLR3_CYPCA
MTDPIMDFFDDSSIFGGGLDTLVQDDPGFTPGSVSLDDELHLGPSLEPLQVDAGSRSSTIQHGIPYNQPVRHFDTMKAQTSMEQSFPGPEGGGNNRRTFLPQQQSFQGHTMNQVPQTNGLFLHNSPMWGNHDQKGNNYHQPNQHHQQIHHQQLQHKQFQQQQQFQQHQAQHQQYSHQHLQHRHNVPQNHSQHGHHNSLSVEGSPFHSTVEASMMPVSSQLHSGFQIAQGVQGFTTGPRLEDNDLAFTVQSSPATHSFPTDSVSQASSYPTAHYTLTGQPPSIVNATQSYSSAPVSMTTSSTAIPSSASNLLDTGCPFLSNSGMEHQLQQVQIPGSPAQRCPLNSSKSNQDPFSSSKLFPFTADCSFSTTEQRNHDAAGPFVTNQSSSNGFQALEEVLLGEQHSHRLDLGDAPDLLADELLPQLEALAQEENSNHSWVNAGLENDQEEDVKDEQGMEDVPMVYNAQVRESVLKSFPNVPPVKSSSSSSSSSSSYISVSEKRAQKRQQQQQQMESSLSDDKQQKANLIISEAIAKARERGEKNIPRVMSPESFPSSSSQHRSHRAGSSKSRGKDKSSKKARIVTSSKSKQKAQIGQFFFLNAHLYERRNNSNIRSLLFVCLQKRRSNRKVKRKKYEDDGEARFSDEEMKVIVKAKKTNSNAHKQPSENPTEEDAAVVDKIMASRVVKNEVRVSQSLSYLHCEWATEQHLEKDKRIQQKIKRFKIKQAQRAHFFADMEEEPFNPDYVEVDRVLEVSYCEDKDTGEPVVYYLVKWCSLPYEDSTWELNEDVDQTKIEEFKKLQAAKPHTNRVERPPASHWKKREQSREYCNGNCLRDYQLEGVNWLLFNWYNRRNCILADEMGLGKTIQSITFLDEICRTGIKGPFLIIAPLSTIANWEREFRTWTKLNVIVYHGSVVSRQMLQQYEMYFRDAQGRVIRGAYRFQAVITTFEMILGGCPELNAIDWRCVIIDEAHRLKNKNCKLLEGFKLMSLEHKVLLTGTPLQNTVEELFSLLHFLEPNRFPSESTFMQEFGDLKTEEQVQKLQAILKPMMLRRLKEDVEKKLAPKEETIIEVELTNIQKKYYRAILEKNFSFLAKGAGQANVPNLLNTMMELRKCCNHPYLIKGAEEKILEDFKEVYSPAAVDFHLQAMIQSAGKLVLIDKLLPKMKAGGHKVLIFSQMVRCLDILEDYLIQRRYLYERIDGRVRGNLRQAAIDRFSKPDSDRFVFLLCTRAGGLGINLTAADTCIIFDSDWNPQNDLRRHTHTHTIGQNKAVKVYRLITRNSYEREMVDRASLKLGLDKAVLQSMSGRDNSLGGGGQQLSKKEIEDLLRRGAYGAIMDEEDEGAKFCEEDIDQILQRRTKTITIESEGRGSTFAKASFVASGNRTDISLDDPNFWDKWAKEAEIDMDTVNGRNSLVIDTPRVRKQTRPFSATKDELAELSEGESSGDDKPKLRRPHDRVNSYGRTECFRVEKNLLVYGWGRWKDILAHGRFKRQLSERDVESICRALLAYCLVHYRGDDKIKSFMWDLIAPTEDGRTKELQNHLGLSAPVPRGRKGKKMKTQSSSFDIQKAEWIRKHNPEHMLSDDGYKKHLKHHCNKVLLRVRMLYYLKQEVIGVQCQKVLDGADASEIEIWVPEPDHSEMPALWWDMLSDKCLLLGVFKHGYEKYNTIRADPALCFLERVGRPDDKAIAAEQRGNDFMDGYCWSLAVCLYVGAEGGSVLDGGGGTLGAGSGMYWPSPSVLTARLRRLITASQRFTKSKQILQIHQTHDFVYELIFPFLNRWTRREEADFYRVVSTFGVVFDPDLGCFDWTKFRAMARLHKKTDESLHKYLCAFIAMCRRVCRLPAIEGDAMDSSLAIQPITEERASRTLYRVELLRKIREQVLRHPQLYERLALCQPGPDLPVWWETGSHDRDLLLGAAKHGVSRTDYHILRDPELCFMAAQRNYSQKKGTAAQVQAQNQAPSLGQCHIPTPLQHFQAKEASASPLPNQTELKEEPLSEGEEESGEQNPKMEEPSIRPPTPSGVDEKDDIQKVGENETSAVPGVKGFDEDSVASLNTTQDDMQDSHVTNGISNPPHPFQGGYMLAASYWPKDRVMINRLDSICQAVLKGKWPGVRRAYDGNAVTSFYTTKLLDNTTTLTEDPSASPQGSKEGSLKLTFQKQGLPLKRPLEGEEGPLAQQQYLARLQELQNASDTSLADYTKTQNSYPQGNVQYWMTLKVHVLCVAAVLPEQMRLNGVMDGQPVIKKRRGRRKNVEGMDLLFMNRNSWHASVSISTSAPPGLSTPQGASTLDTECRVPVISLKDGTRLAGEDAPKRKDLDQWLKEHPGFVADVGAFIPTANKLQFQDGRPKQKRHRCRNPNKIDINSLTGEERVQIINRRNARKVSL